MTIIILQYASIFFLMITEGVYMLIQPFKAMSANIIEAILAVNVLILLLLRQTDRALGYSSSLPQSSSDTNTNISQAECYDNVFSGFSVQALVLIPGYFIPLVVFILATCVSAILKIRYTVILLYIL